MTARGRRQGGRHDQQPGSEAHRGRPSHAAVATGNGLSQGCGWLGTGLHALHALHVRGSGGHRREEALSCGGRGVEPVTQAVKL